MRYLYKVAIAFSIVLLFAPLLRSQTRSAAPTQHRTRTLQPQPRYNAFHAHTFTAVGADVAVRVGSIMAFHQLTWTVTGTVTACSIQVDSSSDGVNWTPPNGTPGGIFTAQTCTSSGHSNPATANVITTFIRLNMTAFSGTGSVLVDYYGFTTNPGGGGGGGPPPQVAAFTLHGNPTNAKTTPSDFSPGGDLSYNLTSTATTPLFSVTGLHFGSVSSPSLPLSSTTIPSSGQCLQYNGTAIVGGTCGTGGGGTGNVSVTNPPGLTSPFLPKATGPTTIADSLFQDTTIAGVTTGLYGGGNFGVGAGDTSCGTTTGCIGFTEGTGSGATPVGHSRIRADATTHSLIFANSNGEFILPRLTNNGNSGQAVISNGDGTFTAADPSISTNTALLFNSAGMGGRLQGTAVPNPLRSGYGSLVISISGTGFGPTTCSIQLFNAGQVKPFSIIQFAVDQGLPIQSFTVVPDPSVQSGAGFAGNSSGGVGNGADTIYGVYDCTAPSFGSGFPSGGAPGLTATFTPGMTTGPPFTCNRKAIINTSTVGATQIVAAMPNTKIYVCGWTVNTASTTAVNVSLIQGTGTNCATAPPTPAIPAFSETVALQALTGNAPVGVVNNAPSNVVDATPYGQALCINLSAGQQVFGKVWYAQF